MANLAWDCSGWHADCRKADPGVVTPFLNGAQVWLWCSCCAVMANMGAVGRRTTVHPEKRAEEVT